MHDSYSYALHVPPPLGYPSHEFGNTIGVISLGEELYTSMKITEDNAAGSGTKSKIHSVIEPGHFTSKYFSAFNT